MLYICGSGITSVAHISAETDSLIKNCDTTLYLLNEPLLKEHVQDIAKRSVNLESIYFEGKDLKINYWYIAEKVINTSLSENNTCALFYGHPTFGVEITHNIFKIAGMQSIKYTVLPAISSLDCLISDLRIDPFKDGLQVYEANHLIKNKPLINSYTPLIVIQPAMVPIDKLINTLNEYYTDNTTIYTYSASLYPLVSPEIKKYKLSQFNNTVELNKIMTLCIID